MPKFDRKPETVEARQFTDKEVGDTISDWVEEHSNARAICRDDTDYFPTSVRIQTDDSPTEYAFLEDWVVKHEDGTFEIVEAADFPKLYKESAV